MVGDVPPGQFALMPSFTFAAAAHAALWCGLTPLLCDIDPATWAADFTAESEMLKRYEGKIAVIIPYATFGYPIDLTRYKKFTAQFGVPVVVDGAASLGTFDVFGHGFGSGFDGSVVYSMHATKSFAVGEAGLIYSANPDRIARIRTMCNFGFGEPRTATMPGLNGKLSEVGALQGRLRLHDYNQILAHRLALFNRYRRALPELHFQLKSPGMQAHQFVPALLPTELGHQRAALRTELEQRGITIGAYFSPHLYEQSYFQKTCVAGPMPVADDVSARMISLPLYDAMTEEEVDEVVDSLRAVMEMMGYRSPRRKPSFNGQQTPLIPEMTNSAGGEVAFE
jgi:dTDP-4-amino-4,6-dideoxygalactose transaminase